MNYPGKGTISLDKDLYRRAYDQYRQWNDLIARERQQQAGQLSPAEAWRRYVELVEFCWRLSPEPGRWQRQEKLAALERYYDAVQKLEVWRREHGKTA